MKAATIDSLKTAYKKEKNAKAKIRIAAAILRKQGYSYAEIKQSLGISRSTISDWMKRMDREGKSGAYDREIPGRSSRLDDSQLVQLKEDLVSDPRSFGFSQSMWTTQMIVRHVKRRYHTEYAPRGMRDLLHRIGFSVKKPRTSHYKSASESDRKAFKKKQDGSSPHTQRRDTPRYAWTSQRT